MKIEGSTVLVTGGNRGIGKAYVEEFLKAGAKKIYVGARNPDSMADFIATDPDKLIPLKLDVTNTEDIHDAVQQAKDVDVLINNAGVLFFDDIENPAAMDQARKQMDVNYFGVLAMTQAFAPILKANGGGLIITISSIVGHVTMPGITTYCASKYAVQSLLLATRATLAEQGTRVIGVYPGPIETDMAADLEMEKFPASCVPQATLKAIESGDDEVFPDEFSQNLYQAFRADPKAVEAQMAASDDHEEEAA